MNDHKFQCQRCGAIYYSDKKAIEWTGAIVCRGPGTRNCWEPRHAQDFVRARTEDTSVEHASPFNWVSVSDVYPNGVTADDL